MLVHACSSEGVPFSVDSYLRFIRALEDIGDILRNGVSQFIMSDPNGHEEGDSCGEDPGLATLAAIAATPNPQGLCVPSILSVSVSQNHSNISENPSDDKTIHEDGNVTVINGRVTINSSKFHFSAQLFAITTSAFTWTIFSKLLPTSSIFLSAIRVTSYKIAKGV